MPQQCPRDLSIGCSYSSYVLPRLMAALWRCPLHHPARGTLLSLPEHLLLSKTSSPLYAQGFWFSYPKKMKALGRKNFVSAEKVVLPSLWKMRMPEIYNIPEQKKISFRFQKEFFGHSCSTNWLSMNVISRIHERVIFSTRAELQER